MPSGFLTAHLQYNSPAMLYQMIHRHTKADQASTAGVLPTALWGYSLQPFNRDCLSLI